MKKFSHYEFTGILIPGFVVIAVGGWLQVKTMADLKAVTELSIGGLGLLVILAYILGHLIQSLGNWFESIYWKIMGGWPSDSLIRASDKRLSTQQKGLIEQRLRTILQDADFRIATQAGKGSWGGIVRQIHAIVAAQGQVDRVELFNANYGLFRGLAVALLVSAIALAINDPAAWKAYSALVLACFLAIARMHRFGVHYGRELFVQFVVKTEGKPEAKDKE